MSGDPEEAACKASQVSMNRLTRLVFVTTGLLLTGAAKVPTDLDNEVKFLMESITRASAIRREQIAYPLFSDDSMAKAKEYQELNWDRCHRTIRRLGRQDDHGGLHPLRETFDIYASTMPVGRIVKGPTEEAFVQAWVNATSDAPRLVDKARMTMRDGRGLDRYSIRYLIEDAIESGNTEDVVAVLREPNEAVREMGVRVIMWLPDAPPADVLQAIRSLLLDSDEQLRELLWKHLESGKSPRWRPAVEGISSMSDAPDSIRSRARRYLHTGGVSASPAQKE